MGINADSGGLGAALREIEALRYELSNIKAECAHHARLSEERWQTLMAISAAVRGEKVDHSKLMWPSFVKDVIQLRAALGEDK